MLVVNDINILITVDGIGATYYRVSHEDISNSIWKPIPENYLIHYQLPNQFGIYTLSLQLKNPYNLSQIVSKELNYVEAVDTTAPSVPLNLSTSNITSNSFTLNWEESTDNIGVVGYDIYINGSKIYTTSELFYNITNLSQETIYNIYIKAFDEAGNYSDNSQTLQVTTLSGPTLLSGNVLIAQVFSPSSTIVNIQDGVSIDYCFITLYNKSNKTINLSNARLYWKYDSYPTWHKVILSGSISPYGYFMIRGSKLTGTISGTNILVDWSIAVPDLDCSVDWTTYVDPNPDDTINAIDRQVSWAISQNYLYIGSKTGVVYLSEIDVDETTIPSNPWSTKDSNSNYVDMVGLLGKDGINDIGETLPISGVKKSLICNRKIIYNAYIDTDNNSTDFETVNTMLNTSADVSALIKTSTNV